MLFDPASLALVLAGTVLATVLQAGLGNIRAVFRVLAGLFAQPFDAAKTKADLARQIRDLDRDGLVRAPRAKIADAEFGQATAALLHTRSIDALLARHQQLRSERAEESAAATQVMIQAADMGQVMGLTGTLIGLATMAMPQGGNSVASAISLAVLTNLYGVVIANLVCLPLAGLIDRRAKAEDKAREDLFRWLESHAELAAPRLHRPAARHHAA